MPGSTEGVRFGVARTFACKHVKKHRASLLGPCVQSKPLADSKHTKRKTFHYRTHTHTLNRKL